MADLPDALPGLNDPDRTERAETDLEWFTVVGIGELRLALPVDEVRGITDPPESTTVVPRTPAVVAGVVDIRGEITAVLEPRAFFPAEQPPAETRRLLVLDRPADRQQAALLIDEAVGVESVPSDGVTDAADHDDPEVAGGALRHPLVTGLLEQEETVAADAEPEEPEGTRPERPSDRLRQGYRDLTGAGAEEAVGEEFTLEPEPAEQPERVERVVVEHTPLLGVDRLLRAASPAAG